MRSTAVSLRSSSGNVLPERNLSWMARNVGGNRSIRSDLHSCKKSFSMTAVDVPLRSMVVDKLCSKKFSAMDLTDGGNVSATLTDVFERNPPAILCSWVWARSSRGRLLHLANDSPMFRSVGG